METNKIVDDCINNNVDDIILNNIDEIIRLWESEVK